MLIPKCCKGCSNRNSGICNCVLPLYCNEFVEDDKIGDINANISYIDMLNKEGSELLVNSLAEKDKQIAELQKQLEEKGKELLIERTTNDRWYKREVKRRDKKIREQRQQLKSQPAEIVEKIKEWGQKHYNWVGDGTGYDGQDYNECIGFNMAINQLNEILDTLLKEYQK